MLHGYRQIYNLQRSRIFKYAITSIQFNNKKNYQKLIHDAGKTK